MAENLGLGFCQTCLRVRWIAEVTREHPLMGVCTQCVAARTNPVCPVCERVVLALVSDVDGSLEHVCSTHGSVEVEPRVSGE